MVSLRRNVWSAKPDEEVNVTAGRDPGETPVTPLFVVPVDAANSARDGETPVDVAPAPAAYRAALVLELLGRRNEPVTLTSAARELSLPKSSVLNLLVSLETPGMVRRTASGWVLGYKVVELSRAALTSTAVVAEFHRMVAGSRALLGETVLLAVLDDLDVIYVARHDGHQPMRYINEIGTRMPAAVTALGRAMLATLAPEELQRRLGSDPDLPVRTSRSLRTVEQLAADLAQVRERGYAIDAEQGVPGVSCFSVPVGSSGAPTAVSASFLADRVTPSFETTIVAELTRLAAWLRRSELT